MLLVVLLLAASGCVPPKYYYNFDVTDPGAKNLTRPGERDVLENPDLKAEILVDPTSFQSILLIITNTTSEPLSVEWHQIAVIGPDRVERPLRPDVGVGRIEPFTKARARLIPFELPDMGNAAASFDGQAFELVVPLVVRGQPKDFRIHLLAHAVKL
jgi:hypothetical protein